MERLTASLLTLFAKHRVIFWYDDMGEMAEQVTQLVLPDVDILTVVNNEFSIKYRLLCQQPTTSFLLYFPHSQPPHEQNWLLDVQLTGYVFRTDIQAQFMQELDLDYQYHGFVSKHIEFFRNNRRRERLAKLGIPPGETEGGLINRMLAVVFTQDSTSLSEMILAYSQSVVGQPDDRMGQELTRFGLADPFWHLVAKRFGYSSASPSIYEFLLELFRTNAPFLPTTLRTDARVLMNRWRVNKQYQDSFRLLSGQLAEELNVPTLLTQATLDALLDDDLFEQVEQRIIGELARSIVNGAATVERIESIQKQRQNKYWYTVYQAYYEVLSHAVAIESLVKLWANEPFDSLAEGPDRYAGRLYRVDMHYRRMLYSYRHVKQADGQSDVLEAVVETIDALYSNQWLLPLTNNWQRVVDQADEWSFGPLQTQRYFYRYQIEPQLAKGRTFVIISDGLRYEWGSELADRMQSENRYEADLSYMVAGLPSYTQLGMAALLPQTQLTIQEGSDNVLADDLPTKGTENRSAILNRYNGVAIGADEFLALNANKEGREWVKSYSVIYIYHNSIDRIGDTLATEPQVVDVSERVLDTIQAIIRKVVNMNGVHIWVTADHGFLYQQQPVDETDFLTSHIGGNVWKSARRYVLGQDLTGGNGFRYYEARQVGLAGNASLLLPKSVQRLRLSGSGSRYVHGGASLQEVVVPLLKITKKKADTIQLVEVDVLKSFDRITTNVVAVSFWQQRAVDDRIQPRHIRAAFFAEDGTILSDQFTYQFDSSEVSDRLREVKHRFQLSQKAGVLYNHQSIQLRLDEPIGGTSQWKNYKTVNFLLTIAFAADF